MGRNIIPFLLEKGRCNLIGVEIGVEMGYFSEYLLNTGLFNKLYSIDPWCDKIPGVYQNGDQYYSSNSEYTYNFAKNLLCKYNESEILRMSSDDASYKFDDNSIDFIFIDGDHTEQGVYGDLKNWYPKVKSGGILSGHDYVDREMDCGNGIISCFKVKTSVDKFLQEKNLNINVVKDSDAGFEVIYDWYSWYIFKP